MSVEAFERRTDELLSLIHEKLKAGICRFNPNLPVNKGKSQAHTTEEIEAWLN